MLDTEIIDRFERARVARLATADTEGRPHLVPITFALLDDRTIVTAVDHKPKRTSKLRRLDNISGNPAVAVLADHYSDAWHELWWVRADGIARIVDAAGDPVLRNQALDALARSYTQYRETPPAGVLIVIRVERWSGWAAAERD